jgi:DNA-binding CsgD family transcriptional regulator
MERQAPHLRRALQLHRVFAPMRRAAASFTEVLERLPVGVLLTDQAGRVWHRNSAAREIVVRNDGLSLSAGGMLSAGTPLANDRLARLVGTAALGGREHAGGHLVVSRPDGKAPYALLITPAPEETVSIFDVPARHGAMVLVSDPDRAQRGELETAMARFRLTPAEIGLLSGLVAGRTLRDYCDERRISINTGKFHLRSLFAKTETQRQVGLVRAALLAMRDL